MKKLLIVIAVGLAIVGGAAWAYSASDAGRGAGHPTSGWSEPADYTYRVWYAIEGPGAGTYDITVRDHAVVAVEPFPRLTAPAPEAGWITVQNAWTLADLEALYREAKGADGSDATITYDAVTGAPSEITLDWVVGAIDDEQYFQILAYEPLTSDPAE